MTKHLLSALTLLALALAPEASLSSAFGSATGAAEFAAQQSPEVRLNIQIENGRTQFQMGEVIPLKLSFTSRAAKKYQINMATYDRSGRMNYEDFLVQPEGGWSDPLEAYFASGAFMGGGITHFSFLSQEPVLISLDLNEWVRFDHPGKYSLRIVSNRVGELSKDESLAGTSSKISSNELQLTIVAPGKAWQAQTLEKAVAVLNRFRSSDGKQALTDTQSGEAQSALKALRYLGTVEATKELARRIRGEDSRVDFECMFGLVGSPYSDVALSETRRLLHDPNHPVSSTFIHALIVLMRDPDQSPEMLFEEDKKNREIIQRELLDAVSQKRGNALALTLNTVLEVGSFDLQGNPKPLSTQIASQIAAIFEQLPVEKQVQMLESRWELIKGPAFLPILRKFAQQPDRDFAVPNEMNAYNSLRLTGFALMHWYEIEPDEARAVIIQEILRPRPRYPASVLGILPDKTLPEVEQALAANFSKEQGSYAAASNIASLLQRYATDAVLSEVLPVVDKNVGKWECAIQTPILAYILRANPDIARTRIEAAMAARGDGYTACNQSLLMELGSLQEDRLLEEIAIRSLYDNDPQVAGNAATFLGKYGSAAAEEKLRQRLTLWNEKWRGREQELRYVPGENNPNVWQSNLGSNLVRALATGQSWLAGESELRRLRQLKADSNIRQDIDSMISGWGRKPWHISYFRFGNGQQRFQVLQYETDSLKAIKEKLAQFPTGSNFVWGSSGDSTSETEKIFNELSKFLTARGMTLNVPTN